MGCCALAWQVSMLWVKQQPHLCICAANNTLLPPPPEIPCRLAYSLADIVSRLAATTWPPRIPFPFSYLSLLVIKVASLMKLESGDKVAVGGALTMNSIFEILSTPKSLGNFVVLGS